LYSPLVGSVGFIVFDDYLDFEFSPGVNPAVNRIVQWIIAGADDVIGTLPNSPRADPAVIYDRLQHDALWGPAA
jgi:hypothetical protein